MYLKLDESKWHKHTYEWSDRSKGLGRVDVYKGQIEVAEDVAPVVHACWEFGKCTKCGGDAPFWCMASTYRASSYCPDCGAKMDEKQ